MKHLLEDAEHVAKGAGSPRYTRQEYDAAMLAVAKSATLPGEDQAAALARLVVERDSRVVALDVAGRQAELHDVSIAQDDVNEMRREHSRIWELILKTARCDRRGEETLEQAAQRLLASDPVIQDAYALYCEAQG